MLFNFITGKSRLFTKLAKVNPDAFARHFAEMILFGMLNVCLIFKIILYF